MSLGDKIRRFLASRRRHKLWKRLVGGLGIIVVFITTYMLILPAITMEKPTYCGIEEHSHTQECYLSCSEGESAPPEYSCGGLENYIHKHNEDCYYNGELVCPLEERENHVHTEECYTEEQRIICGMEESEGHTHDESCYSVRDELVCGMDEGEEHTHDDSCYEHIEELICGQEESEGHTHDDSCYETVRVYNCTAASAHIHDADCYDADGNLICNLEEAEEHIHSDACMTRHENKAHKHTDACYGDTPNCGMTEHKHTDACYENPDKETSGGGGSSSDDKTEETTDNHKDENNDHMGYDEPVADVVVSGAMVGPQLIDLAEERAAEADEGIDPEKFSGKNVNIYSKVGEGWATIPDEPEDGFHIEAKIDYAIDDATGLIKVDTDIERQIRTALGITDPTKKFYNNNGFLVAKIYYANEDGTKTKPIPGDKKVEINVNLKGAAGERYLQVFAVNSGDTVTLKSDIDSLTGPLDAGWYDMIKKFYFVTPTDSTLFEDTQYCFVSTKVYGGYVNSITYADANTGIIDGTSGIWDDTSVGDFETLHNGMKNLPNITENDKAGYDHVPNNRIVRTFDAIQYNLKFSADNRGLIPPSGNKAEPLKIEFTLYKDISQAVFNMGDLAWVNDWRIDYYDEAGDVIAYEDASGKYRKTNSLYDMNEELDLNAFPKNDTNKDVEGEKGYIKTDYNEIIRVYQKTAAKKPGDTSYSSGIVKQVLTGYTDMSIPGEETRSAGIKVLASANNAQIAPVFNAYFEGNPLNLSHEVNPDPGSSEDMEHIFIRPEAYNAALNTYYIGPESTFDTVTGKEDDNENNETNGIVRVTAAPRYKLNVQSNDNLSYKAWFDLENGKEATDSARQNNEHSVRGRMVGYGVTLTYTNASDNASIVPTKDVTKDTVTKGIMGIELPTGDITLDFNVEASATSGGFSTLSLEPTLPIMRLNSAMADTMFSEIILNDGADVLTRISPDQFDSTPLGFNEDGSAIVLDENNGESASSDEGDSAPSDNLDENNENNAFVSDESEDTYFDTLVSDDTEYLAGNVDSINDTVVTALFDEEFYDLTAVTEPSAAYVAFVSSVPEGTPTLQGSVNPIEESISGNITTHKIFNDMLTINWSSAPGNNQYKSDGNGTIEIPGIATYTGVKNYITGRKINADTPAILNIPNTISTADLYIYLGESGDRSFVVTPKNGEAKNYSLTGTGTIRYAAITDLTSGEYSISFANNTNWYGFALVTGGGSTGGGESSSSSTTTTTEAEPSTETSTEAKEEGDSEPTTEGYGTHTKNSDKEEWDFSGPNMKSSGTSSITNDGFHDLKFNIDSSNKANVDGSNKCLKLKKGNTVIIPVRENAKTLVIKADYDNNNKKLSIGDEVVFDTSNDTYNITETDITTGSVSVISALGEPYIKTITVNYEKPSGTGTYTAPSGSNENTATWGFESGAPDTDTELSEATNFNGITYVKGTTGGSSYKKTSDGKGYIDLVEGDGLKIPVEEGYTGGKITVKTTSGTVSVDIGEDSGDGYSFPEKNVNSERIITVTATGGAAQITAIFIAYDKHTEGNNYGTHNTESKSWAFSSDMPQNSKAYLKNDEDIEDIIFGTSKSEADCTSYFGATSLHLAKDDTLTIPVDKGKPGYISVSCDGSLSAGGVALAANITDVRYNFDSKTTTSGSVTITASADTEITNIALSYDKYLEDTFGTFTSDTSTDNKSWTWSFETDMPTSGNAYLNVNDTLEGGKAALTTTSGNSYLGTSGLHLASGDVITVTLPDRLLTGEITVAPTGSVAISTISPGSKTATITANADVDITEIKLTYTAEEPTTKVVKAYVYAEKTTGNPSFTPEDGLELDNSVWSKQNYGTTGTFTLYDSSDNKVSSVSSADDMTGSCTIDGLGTFSFTKRTSTSFKNYKIKFNVPDKSNEAASAKLYVIGHMKNSTSKAQFALIDETTNLEYKEPGGFNGQSVQTVNFDNLIPGNDYAFSCGGSDIYLSLILVTSKEAYVDGNWKENSNAPATAESAQVYVYVPQAVSSAETESDSVYKVNSYASGVTPHMVHTQYGSEKHDADLDIFSPITGDDGVSNKATYTGTIPGYGNVTASKVLGKYGDESTSSAGTPKTVTFKVPNTLKDGVKSAKLYVVLQSTADPSKGGNDADEYRDVILTGDQHTNQEQIYRISGSDQTKAVLFTFDNIKPDESCTLTVKGVHHHNVRYAVFALVLSPTEEPTDEHWTTIGDVTDPPKPDIPLSPGDTSHIPFLWDHDPNYQPDDNGKWGRNLDWDSNGWRTNSARNAAPYNSGFMRKDGKRAEGSIQYREEDVVPVYGFQDFEIHWGGDWNVDDKYELKDRAAYDAMVEAKGYQPDDHKHVDGVNQYPVTVSGYEFDFENQFFPNNYGGQTMGSENFSKLGFGSVISAYSAGYFQVVVPVDSTPVTARGTVRNFRADSLGGTTVTQDGIILNSSDGTTTGADGFTGDKPGDKAQTGLKLTKNIDKSSNKYNSFMSRGATNINDKDISEAKRAEPRDSNNDIVGQFLGNSWSGGNVLNNGDWDASASKGSHIDIWGGYQKQASSDSVVTASNLMQVFDSAVLDIDTAELSGKTDEDLLGRTWLDIQAAAIAHGLEKPRVNILWGVHKSTYKTNGIDSTKSDDLAYLKSGSEDENNLKPEDFTWYDTYNAALSGSNKISAVMAEMRDGYVVNGQYFGFRIPIIVNGTPGKVYATVNYLDDWMYHEGAENQPMVGFTWQDSPEPTDDIVSISSGKQDKFKNDYKRISSGNNKSTGWFNDSNKSTDITYIPAKGATPITQPTQRNDKEEVRGSHECLRNTALNKTNYPSTYPNSGGDPGSSNRNSSYTAGMSLLVTGYKSRIGVEVNNRASATDVGGVPYYNKSSGTHPEFKITGLKTFAPDATIGAETTKLTVTFDITELGGTDKKTTGGIYINKSEVMNTNPITEADQEKMVRIHDDDGYKVITLSSDGNTATTVNIGGKSVTIKAKYTYDPDDKNHNTYAEARQIIFTFEGVPNNTDIGEIIIPTNISAAAENNTTVTAKVTVTGENDIRHFATYSQNMDTDIIGISATGSSGSHKYIHTVAKPTGDNYGEPQYFTDDFEHNGYPELNELSVYTIEFGNPAGDPINQIWAYDILGKVIGTDKGKINVKSVKVFNSNADDRGENKAFPKYNIYTTKANADDVDTAWKDVAAVPPTSGSFEMSEAIPVESGNEDAAIYTFEGTAGDSLTGLYFAIGDADTPAVPAGKSLHIQIICEPVANPEVDISGSMYSNTATFITKTGDTYTAQNPTEQAFITPVSRSISGIVWIDDNGDGIRSSTERQRKSVEVDLFKKNAGGKYEKLDKDIMDNWLGYNAKTGEHTSNGTYITKEGTENNPAKPTLGTYHFNNLPEGEYIVAFKGVEGTIIPSKYQVIAADDTNNIDAVTIEKAKKDDPDFESTFGKIFDGYDFIIKQSSTEYPISLNNDLKNSEITPHVQNEEYWDLGYTIGGDPLPETGGVGTEGIKYAGLAIACGAALMLMWDYTKRSKYSKH